MKRLMRLLFPFNFFIFSIDGNEGGGGGNDDGQTDADSDADDSAEDNANSDDGTPDDEQVTISKKEFDRLQGTIGNLTQKERERQAAEKKAADAEALKRGEHEKLIQERETELEQLRPYKERYTNRVKADHDRVLKAIEAADDTVKGRFKKPADGQELSLDDMEANINKYQEFTELGILKPSEKKKDVIVQPNHVTVPKNQPAAIDPWGQ